MIQQFLSAEVALVANLLLTLHLTNHGSCLANPKSHRAGVSYENIVTSIENCLGDGKTETDSSIYLSENLLTFVMSS